MAKMSNTLLQMTQDILSAMNSDEVTSINDTAESLQVAKAIQQTYFNMLGRYDLPEHNQLLQLEDSDDPTIPTLMTIPEGCTRIESIRYFNSNPFAGSQTDQFGSFSHSLNTDITSSSNWSTSSSTSSTIGTGSKTFTVASGLTQIQPGQVATAMSGINWMTGTVTSYSGTTLVLNITVTEGSGTFTSWQIFAGSPASAPGYQRVPIVPIETFLDWNPRLNTTQSNVGSFQLTVPNVGEPAADNEPDETNFEFVFFYKNDHQPNYCTILSNNFVIFDAYDVTQDTFLQASKTLCYGWMYPQFSLTDGFVPNLDQQQYPLLFNDAKALAFFEQKQFPHAKAEEEVGRQLVSLQKWKAIAGRSVDSESMYFHELPSFGR